MYAVVNSATVIGVDAAAVRVEVFVSADEPVTYVLGYAGADHEIVGQDHTFTLEAAPGDHDITITATDGSGNATTVESRLLGVPVVVVELRASTQLRAGDPLGIRVDWEDTGAAITGYWVELAGIQQHVAEIDGVGVYSVAATPLTVEPAELELAAFVEDEFGRIAEARQNLTLEPLPVTVEQLALSPQTLAVITPEGRELEASTLAAAWAQAAERPYWSEPFIAPIPELRRLDDAFDHPLTEGYHPSAYELSDCLATLDLDAIRIAAHPVRDDKPAARVPEPLLGSLVNAVEINGRFTEASSVNDVRELSTRLSLPIVGGSDAHIWPQLGAASTLLQARSDRYDDVRDAILAGRCRPFVDSESARLCEIAERLKKRTKRRLPKLPRVPHIGPAEAAT